LEFHLLALARSEVTGGNRGLPDGGDGQHPPVKQNKKHKLLLAHLRVPFLGLKINTPQ